MDWLKRLLLPAAVVAGLLVSGTSALAGSSTTYQFTGHGVGTIQGGTTSCAFSLASATTSCQATGMFTAQAGPLPLAGTYVQSYTIAAGKAYVGAFPGEVCAPASGDTALFTGSGNIYMTESGQACEFPPGAFGMGSVEEWEFIGSYSITKATGGFTGASGNGLFVDQVVESGSTAGADSPSWAGTIKF